MIISRTFLALILLARPALIPLILSCFSPSDQGWYLYCLKGYANLRPKSNMKLCLLLSLVSGLLLSSCSTYPLGHSRNGNYYGGQGLSNTQKNYIPRDLQREQEIF